MVAKRLSYKVKSTLAARDGSALIDLTAVVEDILEAGHEGATLHFSIRATVVTFANGPDGEMKSGPLVTGL